MVKYLYPEDHLDATFAALADPTRRAMIAALSRSSTTVSELAQPHSMSLPAVMKHLRILERAGLVSQHKVGRVRHCRLTAQTMKHASDWISQYRIFWEARFDSLERYLAQSESQSQPKPMEDMQCRKPKPSPRSSSSSTAHSRRR